MSMYIQCNIVFNNKKETTQVATIGKSLNKMLDIYATQYNAAVIKNKMGLYPYIKIFQCYDVMWKTNQKNC